MDTDLRNLFDQLGIDGSGYFMNEKGQIMKVGLVNTFTGIYKDVDGRFKKEGFIFDESLGLFQNSKGEFLNEGFIVDDDTGIYQNEKGEFVKKGLIDTLTGFSQNKNGDYRGRFKRDNPNSNSDSESDGLVKLIIYGVGGCFVLALALMALYILFLISPLALLVYYLITKRNHWVWPLLSFILATFLAYTILDPSGLLSSGPFKINSDSDSTLYLSMFYILVAISSALLYLEKHTLDHFPQDDEYGNFFIRKGKVERRPYFLGLGAVLILITFLCFNINLTGSPNWVSGEMINITTGVNIREMDSSSSRKIGSLAAGSQVEFLERGSSETIKNKSDFWYKIRSSDGLIGYVFGAFTTLGQIKKEETSIYNDIATEEKKPWGAIDYIHQRIFDRWKCIVGDKVIELNLYENKSFKLDDFNTELNKWEELTGTFEYTSEKLILNYNDRKSQTFSILFDPSSPDDDKISKGEYVFGRF
ncbi:SH3 domain-containing protein [Spirosomataceae bacterium TFI 002]|nr:SH3 domain-containing protein [Spirosomataceae bacterium TFI 002]